MASGKQPTLSSPITLAHIAWIAMFCGIMLWGFGGVKSGELGNTGNWYRMGLVFFAGIAGTAAFMRTGARIFKQPSGPLILLFTYGSVALFSSMLVPAHAFYVMWKGLEILICVIIIAAILGHGDARSSAYRAYTIIITIFSLMLLAYWIEGALMPSKVFLPSRGVIPFTFSGYLPVYNGNTLAFLCAFLSVVTLANITRCTRASRRFFLITFLLVCLASLIITQSRTSLVGFIVASALFLFFDRRYTLFALAILISFLLLIVGGLSGAFEEYFTRGQSDELFTSLSGRTHAWGAAWELFKQSPLVGHGFAAAARVKILGMSGASTLHGSIFDVIVGTGILGLLPWSAAIIWTTIRILRLGKSNHPWFHTRIGRSVHAEMVAILVLVLIRSTTSSGLAMHEHTFMLFLALVAYTQAMTHTVNLHKIAAKSRSATPKS